MPVDLPSVWTEELLFGHSLQTYVSALVIFLVVWLLAKVFFKLGTRFVARLARNSDLKDQIISSSKKIRPWFYFAVALLAAIQNFELPEKSAFILNFVLTTLIFIQVLVILSHWVRYFAQHSALGRTADGKAKAISNSLASIVILAIWAIGFLFLLDNFGFNITTVLAGLGIGGIAVGLALQSILGDVFASFAIALDKPFEIGDFIIIDDFLGSVEHVGLKTTRLRSLGGEQLVFSNRDLVNSRIRNYKQMAERRVVFKFGVTYDTGEEQLESIPDIVRNIINSLEQTRFDRAHLASFAEYSLLYEVVYYVLQPSYNVYMDIQQEINFQLLRALRRRGIRFALPTTTIDLPEKAGKVLAE